MAHSGTRDRFPEISEGVGMRRRQFLALAAAAAFSPRASRAQQRERARRIGALMAMTADDPEAQARLAAFAQGLGQSGWTIGQNVRVDYRFAGANADDLRRHATELVALAPDVIIAHSSGAVAPLLQASGWSCSRRLRPA
jgi:putative ABC transport system substrate-binding protein